MPKPILADILLASRCTYLNQGEGLFAIRAPRTRRNPQRPQPKPMPTTTTTRAKEHQEQWDEVVSDPSLRDLPYNVETNRRGQIVLSPHTNRHSFAQEKVADLLEEHAPDGFTPPEFAIATPEGVKSPDIVWMSPARRRDMEKTGDPTTLAPEICVEVLSFSNTEEELRQKRELYFAAGATEVWTVGEDGQVRFFDADGDVEASDIAPRFPDQI